MNSIPVAVKTGFRLRMVRAYVALMKPRIIELLLTTTLPAMVVAQRGLPSLSRVLVTLAGGTLSAGGANAVNMWFDRDIDAVMKRTKSRPLVTGEITPAAGLAFAIAIEALSFLMLWRFVNLLSAVLSLAAALFYVFVYTMWLKRSSSQNIVIGGAAGAAPVLVGWAAVQNDVTLAGLLMFLVIFLWTPPHFWALAFRYREDYSAAGVPMLPSVATFKRTAREIIVYTIAMVAVTLLLGPVAHLGAIYEVAAALLGAGFLYYAFKLRASQSPKLAMRVFSYSITYLTLLFLAMGVDVLVHHL
ncbi:MAG: heme o synthase [Actinomycetota bacterium]|nr:heme o synthase [Actinomycetota bacterium]